MRAQLKLRSPLLPLIVAGLFFLEMLAPLKVSELFLVGLGGLWLLAFLYTRYLSAHLSLLRELRYGWVQVGDMLEERFTLINTGWLPAPWVEIEDLSTLPGYNASLATGVDGFGKTRWVKQGVCSQRGYYQLGYTRLNTGDPFGIYELTLEDPARRKILVMPPVIPLPPLAIASGGFDGDGRTARNARDNTLDASSVRKYIFGDSTKLIHWKTTARMDEPYIRLFDGAPASTWWVLLDLQGQVQIGDGEKGTLENGIILAASLVDYGLRSYYQVGMLINGQDTPRVLPRSALSHRWEILRALALASSGDLSLAHTLKNLDPSIRQGSTLVLVTPTNKVDWLEEIPNLQRRGIALTVFLFDPESFEGQAQDVALIAELKRMGIRHYSIPRTLFERSEARPGTAGRWEWRVSATGRAIPVKAPKDYSWQRLSK